MKLAIFLTLSFLSVQIFNTVFAATSATPAADLESKVKELVESKLSSQEATLTQEIKSFKGYQGTIKALKNNILSLQVSDDLLQIKVMDDTPITDKGQPGKISSLAINSTAIAYVRQVNNNLQAARVSLVTPNDPSTRAISFIGLVTKADAKQITLEINGTTHILKPSSKTKIKLDTFKSNQTIIGTYKIVEDEWYLTRGLAI